MRLRVAMLPVMKIHSHVPAGHGKLAYYRFGQGPDVVLVHGWPLHAATFRHLVPLLEKHFTLHLFDLPGTGNTQWEGPIDLASDAKALRRAIGAIGLKQYALLAHDSGGAIARLVAADDPRVTALVMGNTEIPGHRPWQLEAYVLAGKIPGATTLVRQSLRFGMLRRSVLAFGGCFTDPSYVDGEFFELFVRPLFTSPKVAQGQMELVRTLDFALLDSLRDVHARIKAPVLCIWGPRDPFFPIAKATAMTGGFAGGASLVSIPDGALFAHEDHPAAFAAHAIPFLAA